MIVGEDREKLLNRVKKLLDKRLGLILDGVLESVGIRRSGQWWNPLRWVGNGIGGIVRWRLMTMLREQLRDELTDGQSTTERRSA